MAVDRNERAFDLALEEGSAGIDPELLHGAIARFGRRPDGSASPDAVPAGAASSRVLLALHAAGGFPVLGSAPGQGTGRLDPAQVLATLTPEPETADRQGVADLTDLRPLETAQSAGSRRRRGLHVDYLTAALGLVLGISLTSSPLYPDLIALARRKARLLRRLAGSTRARPHDSR
jgi:hypothetical protein